MNILENILMLTDLIGIFNIMYINATSRMYHDIITIKRGRIMVEFPMFS